MTEPSAPAIPAGIGADMHALVRELYPICRSITGDGVRETLKIVQRLLPLEIREVPSGAQAFDWTVPREWNIRAAWIRDRNGKTVVDFKHHNLHVLNYSIPVRAKLSLAELRPHLYTLPDRPDWIPYRTSYYNEKWGFCLSQRQLDALPEGEYEVCIDATLEPGHLTYGECLLAGESEDEILFSTHVCHPSLANDNLSGISVAAFLGRHLRQRRLRHSIRLLFVPGTIGSITWLSENETEVGRIRHGLVLTGLGDAGGLTYKRSRRGDAEIDRVAAHVLAASGWPHEIRDFHPYGYDERQYCSPGFNLPVGRLSRSPYGEFPEYHTSADNPDFVKAEQLELSLRAVADIVDVLEANGAFVNRNPKCEPQLGKRGLYRSVGGVQDAGVDETAMLWVLNLCDGKHSLLDIAERARLPFSTVLKAKDFLLRNSLLAPRGENA